MKKHIYTLLLLAVCGLTFVPGRAVAQAKCNAFVVLSGLSGQSDTLRLGDSGQEAFEAPLVMELNAGFTDIFPGTQLFSEWRVTRGYMSNGVQQESEYLSRQDSVTTYTLTDYGSYTVQFAYSYREPGSSVITPADEPDPIKFSVDASDMTVPNAFSPNGDGINDVFKVKVRSIVQFKMSIFNRWGQLIKSGTEQTLEYEDDVDGGYYVCWDGTHGGKVVADGVYYIHIEAVGAGGKKYTRKSDINILTGLSTK